MSFLQNIKFIGISKSDLLSISIGSVAVVGFTPTYSIRAYHADVVSSNLDQGEVYNIMR